VTEPYEASVVLLDLDAPSRTDDAAVLPTADLVVAAHITDEQRRRWFLAVRRELRLLLAPIVGLPPAEITIDRGRNGKPQVKSAPVHFSVASRDAACVIATSLTQPVGVEIARVPVRTPVPVLQEILPLRARTAVLAAEPDQQAHTFAVWWCRVEAAVRACGAGLHEAAACLDTAPQDARDVGSGRVAAVALAGRRDPLETVRWLVEAPVGASR
jgi:phosphopantetheinyl transferase